MFAQGRKYGLALTVAHQNLDQLPKELREVDPGERPQQGRLRSERP